MTDVLRCPRCGFVAIGLKRLPENRAFKCCPECKLLIAKKKQLPLIRDMVSSPFSRCKDLRENKVFGLLGPHCACDLMVVEDSGEIHRWNRCMDCGKVIEGTIYRDLDEEPGRVLYLCEKCVDARLREKWPGLT